MEETEREKKENHVSHDIKTLLSWSAPGRPFVRKSRDFYLSILLIGILLDIILFLFSQYIAMLAVVSLVFLSFVLSTVPPKNFHYKITSEGIKIEDYFYIWRELYDFYFKKIDGEDILFVRTQDLLPGELKISLGSNSRDHVRKVLISYLPFREVVRQTFVEKSADWLTRNFPLEHKTR